MKVRELMSADLVTLDENDTLADAQRCMERGRIRHLPVVHDGKLTGLLTHRDLLSASFSIFAEVDWQEQRRIFSRILVKELMHRNVKTVAPDLSVADAARILYENKYGCLPVVAEDGTLVGLITEADFLKLTLKLLP
jgi:CBS domain-containing membrane protein